MDFLLALENSSLGTWVRESPSLLAYPLILFLHTLGLALLVGFNTAVDLRILGVGRGHQISPMQRFFPVMVTGFWISALSGTALVIADATTMLRNPLFIAKLVFIALAITSFLLLRRQIARSPEIDKTPVPGFAKVLAGASLACWILAITAGRLTAYLGSAGSIHSLGS